MKKINPISVQEKLKEKRIKIFSVFDFQRIFDLNYEAAKRDICRYVKSGILVKARKGFYFLKSNPPLDFELANYLYQPSYISLDTALSFYGIIPETIYQITSATPNLSREFKVGKLKFIYQRIKKECFLGYRPEKIKNILILIAEPEKALADFLYQVALKKRNLSYERINLQKIKKSKLLKFAKCFKNKKILRLIKEIYA